MTQLVWVLPARYFGASFGPDTPATYSWAIAWLFDDALLSGTGNLNSPNEPEEHGLITGTVKATVGACLQ